MSVGLYKYDGDINDRDSKLILSENIASQQFYEKHWERAIKELNIKYIQDGAEFDFSKKRFSFRRAKIIIRLVRKESAR